MTTNKTAKQAEELLADIADSLGENCDRLVIRSRDTIRALLAELDAVETHNNILNKSLDASHEKVEGLITELTEAEKVIDECKDSFNDIIKLYRSLDDTIIAKESLSIIAKYKEARE